MGFPSIIVSIFVSAILLWLLLRFLAKHEADLSPPRYPMFGAFYWFAQFIGGVALNLQEWVLIPLALLTALALYHFFFVTMLKSLWLAVLFVVLRSALSLGWAFALEGLKDSVAR